MLVQHSEVEEGFESKALVFISQQDAQSQPALREVLRLSKGETDALMAEADGELKQVLELHGLARPSGQLAHLKPLCHCVLNSAMSMCEMLTEPRCEALQWLVELRARESLARRFEGKPCTAVLDGLEFRRGQLEDWKRLLAPFSWKHLRAPVMSQVLTAAGLCEPLTKHVQLVRSYEFLRCLGGELLDGDMQSSLEKLRQHGERFAAWQAADRAEDALAAYRKTVMASDVPKDVLEAEAQAEAKGADLARLGFRPSAVLKIVAFGGALPGMVLGHLAQRLLTLAEQEASAQLDADTSLRELHQHFVQMAEACKSTAPVEAPDSILKFLLQVAKDYLSRGGGAAHLNFELLARGSPNMQLLRTLETHPAAQRVLGDMALSELLQVASLIREAQHMVHKDAALHGNLQRWLSRLDANELHPAEVGELSAALHDFLKQNLAARLAAQEEALHCCVLRALGGRDQDVNESGTNAICLPGQAHPGSQQLLPRPARGATNVLACFDEVILRSIPLGLAAEQAAAPLATPGAIVADYEVREIGLRSGMYLAKEASAKGSGLADALDATVICYQWVPPGEVREDSQPLQQILASCTHVQLKLPGKEHEEVLVDLFSKEVTGSSSWYQVLPSSCRDAVSGGVGFWRLALQLGPDLRLPLPRGLFDAEGVTETAEVLAQLLAVWFSQRHSLEEVCAALRRRPALVYFASTALLDRFDELGAVFKQALQRHWSEVLESVSRDGDVLPEVKDILLQLLLAGPNDCLAAVLPGAVLGDFCSLVKRTRLSLELLAVERFCFESALERIGGFQNSTVTFVLVEITGQLSALQLSELIRRACGSIRLVFSWYPGLLPKLALTLSLGSVLLPKSLEADLSSRCAPTLYRDTFPLGQVTKCCSQMQDAELLSPLDGLDLALARAQTRKPSQRIDWAKNLEQARAFLQEAHAWMEREAEWRSASGQRQEMLLLLVASDEALVQRHYGAMDGVHIFRLNHAERQVLAPVEALLERVGPSTPKLPIIVLLGVGFITPSKLEDLVARAYVSGVRVILVAPEPLAFLRCIRVTTRRGTEYLQATVLNVRSAPRADGPDSLQLATRALRIVVGAAPSKPLLEAMEAEDAAQGGQELAKASAAGGAPLRAEVAADLCAGLLSTLSAGSAAAFDGRSLAFAVGALAAAFAARSAQLRDQGLVTEVWDLSFADFRALPVSRFLDQVSVLEAWCRYLDFVGVQAEVPHHAMPQGLVWPSERPGQLFLSQWYFASNTHAVGVEELLEQSSPQTGTERSAAPTYWSSGPHQSEDPEEVLERRCLQLRDLDWANFSEKWKTALDIKPQLFLQLCALGVDTLRLFLCLPPQRAIELGHSYLTSRGSTPQAQLGARVARKLLRDLSCTAELLEPITGQVAPRLAAVKWLLLTVLEDPRPDGCRMTEPAIQQLAMSNVMLCPRGRGDLLRRVASMLISLDGIDVLNSQYEIRRFLLETDLPLSSLLPDSAKLGRSVVSLLFCPDHAENVKRGELGLRLVADFQQLLGYDILHWQPLAHGDAHRLTAAAHAAVLDKAPSTEVVEELVRGPLLSALSKLCALEGCVSADAFLASVLENLSSDLLVLTILKVLSCKEASVSKVVDGIASSLRSASAGGILAKSSNPFLPALFTALQTQSLGNYLSMAAAEKARPLQLSLDSSMQDLYIQYFRQLLTSQVTEELVESTCRIHRKVLDDASCGALFQRLLEFGEAAPASDRVLLWYCWARSPDRQLPFWALPSSAEHFVLALNAGGSFVQRCRPMRAGLSVLAKFLVAPEALPLGVYNTLAEKAPWAHGEATIQVQTLLLGQEDQEEYPPYCIRWHARGLPAPLKAQLLRRCKHSVSPLLDTAAHDFYPRLNGMSESNLRFNLGLLLALRSSNPDLQIYFDHGAEHQRQFLAGCILCWTKAAGLSSHDLLQCVQPEECGDFQRLLSEIQEAYARSGPTSLRRMYVRGPLPTDIEVRWVEGRDVPILARSRDSAVLTAQWLNMLLLHFKLDLEPFVPEDLVLESADSHSGGARQLQNGPRLLEALPAVSAALGRQLARDLSRKRTETLVVPLGDGKFDTLQLVTRITVLADFVFLLRSGDTARIGQFFEHLTAAFAEIFASDSEAEAEQPAALFDAFFLLHGCTSENEALEVEALAKAFQAHDLPVSAQTMEEVRWLHENYYGRKEKNGVKSRLPRFAAICDRIERINKLQLRKVTFQRHFARTLFVGELLAREMDVNPPYLLQSSMQLLCSLPSPTGDASKSGEMDEDAVRRELQSDEVPTFFTEVGDYGRPAGASGVRSYGQWEWPDLSALHAADWNEPCPVISAADVVEVVSEPSHYLHALIRVRPGLEPVLWHSAKSPGFYRLSAKCGSADSSRNSDEAEKNIWKAFATNAEAWQFIDRASSPVLSLEGWYLRKAEDQSWVVIFPAARDPAEVPVTLGELTLRPRRFLLWPVCHSQKLLNLNLSSEALRVVELLVTVAWQMCKAEKSTGGIDRALTELSAMSNQVEHLVSVQDLPESNEELVADVRQLQKYQQIERFLAEVLLRILWKMKSQQRDDLGGLIREESLRRWATMQVPFVEAQEPQALSSLGRALQRLLVPIASKAGITGAPATTRAWTQLELILEACYRGEHLPKERCLAKHIHVTKSSFGKRGVGILQSIYHAQIECRQPPTVQHFSDSEDDGDAECKDPGVPRRSFMSQAKSDKAFVDTHMDRDPQAGSMLFERQVGFGRPLSSRNGVMTFYDEDLPLYYIQLDRQRLKVDYSSSDGLGLGYLVHKNVLAELLEDASRCNGGADGGLQLVRSLRMKFLPWIADVLRSPLPSDTKTWILRCCERMGLVAVAPYQERSQVNLAIMAFSLCRCCPAGSDAALFLRSVLMNAWHVPEEVKRFAERKSDVYGIYIVKPGTLQRMQELGLRVVVRDFEREVWQRSMDNSSMYLDIISQFSSYCCFTYVKGLSKLDDILLKWLAEYTRLHPWRFVYIEGVDTTFNFPENRDRCNFRFAPANPLHSVKATEDLQKSNVTLARPSHTVSYDPAMQPSPEDLQDGRRLLSFFAKNLAPDSSTGSHADDAMHQETMFSQPPRASCYSADFRGELEELLFGAASCLVLLVSAPGAGKSHHMSALRGRLQEEMQFDIHEFDGSSDILVTTALAEVLQRTMISQSTMHSQKLLILDEYHMLSDEHKDELFEWVRAKLGPELRVVLIANRSDSKDRERLEQLRPAASQVKVAHLQTRLSRKRIEQVMDARGNSEKWRPAVCDWLVASRLLFGEEAVSLRLCDTLEAILQKLEPRASLIELLLHRVPTVSRTSASDFVDAYLQHQGLRKAATQSLVSFCFRAALQDLSDELCSFVEFLSLTPRAHEAPPAVRLLAWACYVMNAKKWDLSGLSSVWSKRHLFVDQVNFPFELSEEALGSPSNSGPTFSWAGDPTSLRDLVDAVRRGHSVDWADVHRKVWSVEHIKDSELFAQLLSLSRTPSVILQQVLASNLCSLLRLSNTAAPTAVQLARIILQHAPVDSTSSSQVDRPRCLSLWTVILHDQQELGCVELLRLAGGPSALLEAVLWARNWATERRSTAPARTRERLLQQTLALLSCCSWKPLDTGEQLSVQELVMLWTGGFACLLRAARPVQERVWRTRQESGVMSAEFLARGELPPALPQQRLQQVLRSVADLQADWPLEVRLLWRVLHSRSSAQEVSKLWVAAPYMLQDMSSEADTARVHELFIPGIVASPGTLCRSLQRALLCSTCQVPESVPAAMFLAVCADALNELRNADQLHEVRIGGAGGVEVQRILKEES